MLIVWMMLKLTFQTIFIFLIGFCQKSWSGPLQTQVKLQGETLNFEIVGQKDWDYDLKKITIGKQTKVQLLMAGSTAADLQKIKLEKNPFVESIKVLPNQVDGKSLIEFTLANQSIEAFDYLTEQPSKLVIDFYRTDELMPTATKDLKSSSKKNIKTTSNQPTKNSLRNPASVDYITLNDMAAEDTVADFNPKFDVQSGLFDGADTQFSRFRIRPHEIDRAAMTKGLSNYYLDFPMLDQEFHFWKTLKANQPEYEIIPKDTEENKQARLLKLLYDKKRTFVLRKTTEWFERKFPDSPYLEIAYYMNADSMLDMWKKTNDKKFFDEATVFYNKAMQKFPESKLKERTSLYLAFVNVDRNDYLTAIRKLNAHMSDKNYQGKASYDYAKLGLALSMDRVNKTSEALDILADIEKKSSDPLVRAEAAYHRGDFYFHDQKFSEAIDSYNQALKKYPQFAQKFPNAYFNRMEAQFRLAKPEAAHASALEFVQKFPSHELAPYALTRVGELLESLGADPSKSVGAYLETLFRYGDNPKTVVARLHLLSTRMKVMKQQELDETLKKMDELASQSDLKEIDKFKSIMVADGYNRRKEYDKAIDTLAQFLQKEPHRIDAQSLSRRIVKNIAQKIQDYSDNNDIKQVLATYKKYSEVWLKKEERSDIQFALAKAYLAAGAYGQALKKLDKSSQIADKLNQLSPEQQAYAEQKIPSADEVALLRAQCLYEENQFQMATDEMKKIVRPEGLSLEDQIKRIDYTAKLYEKKNDSKTAIRYLSELVKLWENEPNKVASSILHLADLEVKAGNPEQAMQHLQGLIQQKPDADFQIQASKKLYQLALEQKNESLAETTLQNLLEQHENQVSMPTERYRLGEIFFNRGELKKAQDVWSQIKETDGAFWKQLAENKMRDSNWRDENKKYLKRIPATSKMDSMNNINDAQKVEAP